MIELWPALHGSRVCDYYDSVSVPSTCSFSSDARRAAAGRGRAAPRRGATENCAYNVYLAPPPPWTVTMDPDVRPRTELRGRTRRSGPRPKCTAPIPTKHTNCEGRSVFEYRSNAKVKRAHVTKLTDTCARRQHLLPPRASASTDAQCAPVGAPWAWSRCGVRRDTAAGPYHASAHSHPLFGKFEFVYGHAPERTRREKLERLLVHHPSSELKTGGARGNGIPN